MFGSASSAFGSRETSGAASNPFCRKPFGRPGLLGSSVGSGMFGSMSSGAFGRPSSPLAPTPAFGVSPTPAFGTSSIRAFGASSAPAFGVSSSASGGSSTYGAKPAFGSCGSTSSRMSPFGSTFQQTQPASESSLFATTTPFGASQPAFGASNTTSFGFTSTPAFGATSTPAFGATSARAFGSTSSPPYGATSAPAFGSTSSLFGSTGTSFGVSSSPAFGSTPTFGVSSSSICGSSKMPAFGASSTPSFGSFSVPAFQVSSSPSFGFSSAPSFGQSKSTFRSAQCGSASPFGTQSSPSGTQTTTFVSPSFGQQSFSGQQIGRRAGAYAPTPEVDSGTQAAGKLESVSAMTLYNGKSHKELRWEDFRRGDKGGPGSVGQAASALSFPSAQTSPFGSTTTLGQIPAFSSAATNPSDKTLAFGSTGFGAPLTPASSSSFGVSPTPSLPRAGSTPASGASSTPLFGISSAPAFGATSAPALGTSSTPLFGGSATSTFGSSCGSSSTATTTPAFSLSMTFGGTPSSGLFQSSPSVGQTSSLFGLANTGFGQSSSSFGSSIIATPLTEIGEGLFRSSTSSSVPSNCPFSFSQSTPSLSTPLQPAVATQTSGTLSFTGVGQAEPGAGSFGSMSSGFTLGTLGQFGVTHSGIAMQPAPVGSPFGTLPAMPHMSMGCASSTASVHYGISSLPVAEKPVLGRILPLPTPRHLTRRRIKLPARKYHPKTDGPLVPFFTKEEEAPSTSKADALFIPRDNPRAMFIHPIEKWSSQSITEREAIPIESASVCKNGPVMEEPSPSAWNGTFAEDHTEALYANGFSGEQNNASILPKSMQKQRDLPDDVAQKGTQSCYHNVSRDLAGDAVVIYENSADTDALMPRLSHPEYYTEPRIDELAAMEQAHEGFICHVKDLVIGRHGYGSIKFDGETDVRRLDLDSIIQFNHREVVVYKDESRKPPVGQGLNKPALVTLLNVKCINKKTGQQYSEGSNVEKYKEMLIRRAEEQGAEFVSYDAAKGEWKFKVNHFSYYNF